jgi:hypothetical protein
MPELAQLVQPLRRGLPAMMAPLMAPMEVPITQSGSMPASCKA